MLVVSHLCHDVPVEQLAEEVLRRIRVIPKDHEIIEVEIGLHIGTKLHTEVIAIASSNLER